LRPDADKLDLRQFLDRVAYTLAANAARLHAAEWAQIETEAACFVQAALIAWLQTAGPRGSTMAGFATRASFAGHTSRSATTGPALTFNPDHIMGAGPGLKDEKLLIDHAVLNLHPDHDGMQHDETRSVAFRHAKKLDRDPIEDATLHNSVLARFDSGPVLQYDLMEPYRPEPLRHHIENKGKPNQIDFNSKYYSDIALPHVSCWHRILAASKSWPKRHSNLSGHRIA
jgi:hypothetical protein